MPATPYDSAIWRSMFHDHALATLFSDTAVLRAELLVMGTLALAQAKAGLVPEISAKAIQRAALEVQIDPAALAPALQDNGDHLPALVVQFKAELKAPEHAAWVHHDSLLADTAATGLALRLRQITRQFKARLGDGPHTDRLAAQETGLLCAYHKSPDMQDALAKGLGLHIAATRGPLPGLIGFADWIVATAANQPAMTPPQQVALSSLAPLRDILTRATPETCQFAAAFTLPQMCLGLGVLLPATDINLAK